MNSIFDLQVTFRMVGSPLKDVKIGNEIEKLKHDYGERLKELNCIYEFSKLVETPNISLYQILKKTNELLPNAWQYPEIACSRIVFRSKEFQTANFKEPIWKQRAPIKVGNKKVGFIEVGYLKETSIADEGPFLIEERRLLDAVSERLGRIIERISATNQLKKSKEKYRRLFSVVQRRQSEVVALLKASEAVLQNKEFESSARAVFESCKELIGATAGYIALLSDDGKDNIVLFLDSGGKPCSVDPNLPMPIRGLRAEAYLKGKTAIENDFGRSKYQKFLPNGHVTLRNVLFAPLSVESKTVGTIGLANKATSFTNHDAKMASAFGKIASIALTNSNMLEMLEEKEKSLRAYNEDLERLVEERTNQLKSSERLATIGTTAGMVGHDIRNPLQSITSELYLAKEELKSVPDNKWKNNMFESICNIENDLEYINKIVQDLQDYTRKITPVKQEVNLEELLIKTIFNGRIPENIQASLKVDEKIKNISTDPAILTRIITNLVNNAVQAMPEGGKLVAKASLEETKVKISIEDTGSGIPEDVRPKLFTPLFTTKSKGQGFGLAAVKRLTLGLDGSIEFLSEQGKGTKFTITFPN